ncbi:unnamed protein product [Mytilus edulis]|uniref:Uncharacterized protein n=1 Tax=Mytilus edulis TaxID=6550 RepID=A0A8S3QTG7_MYTED|nr:unnamed protein product [Mytilus edulis]
MDPCIIRNEQKQFYKKLYTSSNPLLLETHRSTFLQHDNPFITKPIEEEVESCEGPLSVQECLSSLKHMKNSKSPEECENEEILSLQRREKSDDWFHHYETEFKQEYNSENPFFKKIENKSYAQAARQAPNRKTNKQSKYQNKYVYVEKVRPDNTYNNRNRSSSTSRRNNFQNQQNQRNRFMQGNRNHSPTNNFRQNHQQRNDESTESQNNNRNPYQRNRNSRELFLEPGERNRDTRWNRQNVRYQE